MRRVLLVSDHHVIRQSLGKILEWDDVEKSTQARSVAKRRVGRLDGAIDVAVVDLELRAEDATELIMKMRQDEPDVPVLVLTTAPEEHKLHERLRERGVEEVLSQEASLERVVATIRRLGVHKPPSTPKPGLSYLPKLLQRFAMSLTHITSSRCTMLTRKDLRKCSCAHGAVDHVRGPRSISSHAAIEEGVFSEICAKKVPKYATRHTKMDLSPVFRTGWSANLDQGYGWISSPSLAAKTTS